MAVKMIVGNQTRLPESLTAQYLTGQREISVPRKRRKGNGGFITLSGVKTNNLKDVDLKIPLGTMTCVTGVSGGGKSSLILETLFKAVNKELNGSREPAGMKKGTAMREKESIPVKSFCGMIIPVSEGSKKRVTTAEMTMP